MRFKKDSTAVIVGAGIAGLLIARVLLEHFESVTIVDTDKLPDLPDIRKGVAQSAQPHVLLTKGYRILEELFPGIGASLTAAGALTIDWPREFHHFGEAGWSSLSSAPSEIVSFTCSRPLLEWVIRQRLSEFSAVRFVEQHRVIELLSNTSKTQVEGVRIQSLRGGGKDELPATLVVDAGGRRSQAPQWLKNLGFTPPPETVINPFLGYATRRYQQPSDFEGDWKIMLISQQPPANKRLGYLAKIENGEWIATLGGYGGDFPPLDDEGFLEFAHSLPSPKFYEAIASATPVSPIVAHRATANRWRHYEKIQLPMGFISVGDAVCALCPVYGQGMTVSALSAIVLRDLLKESKLRKANTLVSPHSFQKKLAKSNSFHWMLATGQDSRFLTTSGRNHPSKLEELFNWYTQQVIESASFDAEVHTLFIEIAHLLKSPLALYHPKVVFRVLTQGNSSAS